MLKGEVGACASVEPDDASADEPFSPMDASRCRAWRGGEQACRLLVKALVNGGSCLVCMCKCRVEGEGRRGRAGVQAGSGWNRLRWVGVGS